MKDVSQLWNNVRKSAVRYSLETGTPIANLAKAYDDYIKHVMREDPKAGDIQVMIMVKPVPIAVKRKDIPGFLIAHPEYAMELVKPWVT